MELLKNLEGLSADEQMTAVVELQKAAMKHLEEQKQASIGKSAELVIQGLKKIKSDFEAKFDSLNYDIQTKVASLKDGEQGLQGPKGDQGERGLDGANGRDGRDGKDGKDGIDGVDGVGVRDAKIDFDGSLVISLTDGREINCGEVVSVDVAKQIQKVTHNIQTGSGGDSQTVLDAIAAIQATIATYGTMATQNANNVAITGGAINNTTIGATTPSTGVFTTLTATGTSYLGGSSTSRGVQVDPVAGGTTTYTQFTKNTGINEQQIIAANTSNLGLIATGGGTINFYTASNNTQKQLVVAATSTAVNYVQVTGSATGNNTTISAQGSDSAIGVNFQSKGTSGFNFFSGGGSNRQLRIDGTITSVNYLDVWGGASGSSPSLRVAGSDTNISQVFQSKGTGAIDLAAGSSGVNISNGGTVTAITRTATGSGYTSTPTFAISAPTTAGGTQATATPNYNLFGLGIVSGGTGYNVGNVLTIVGGTYTDQLQVSVTAVSSGVITSVSVITGTFGIYTQIPPSNPATVTGGTGTGATFNLTWTLRAITIDSAGSGYVEQPTVTFSGGGGSGAAAYATVGSTTTFRSIGHSGTVAMRFDVPSSLTSNVPALRLIDAASTQDSGMQVCPATGGAIFNAFGATNAYAGLFANGTGQVKIGSGGTGQTLQLNVSHTASAVNYVQVTGAATGADPVISAQGSDSNIRLILRSKGSLGIRLQDAVGNTSFATATGGGSNFIQTAGTATTFGPVLSAAGGDTDIPLVLQPKGTGALQAQQTDSTATGGNARGSYATDLQKTRASAGQVASNYGSVIVGGESNTASGYDASVIGGAANTAAGLYSVVGGGYSNTGGGSTGGTVVNGYGNQANGFWNFIGNGAFNTGTSASAVTTQSATMNGTTAVTLSASNANIKVGQVLGGTYMNNFPHTYVVAVSGTSLTLSQAATGSGTATLSFYTPHGVVVGGGNNQATGAYSFIGGGGDAGTAANRNVASGDWSVVGGGRQNTASASGAFVGGGGVFAGAASNNYPNTASGTSAFIGGGLSNTASQSYASVLGGLGNSATGIGSTAFGIQATTRSITGYFAYGGCDGAVSFSQGVSQVGLLTLGRQTTDATATVLTSNSSSAATQNQVILPNNSAYYFKGTVIANVTGGGNTKGWTIEGAIKRGANAASTALVGTPTVTSSYADAGASTWAITATADTTNGGLAITFTGQASTTIRVVAKLETTEVTF